MIDDELRNIDPGDIEDLLEKVETSFDIKFAPNELVHITTFGELCDHIANKINLDNANDSTSQQAFYKLRDGISSTLQIDKKTISPNLPLADLFPKENRRLSINRLEAHLGFKLNILRPPRWLTNTLLLLTLAAIVGLFFNWQYGVLGFVISVTGRWLANSMGNEFAVLTIGQVAEKMTIENYLKSRRNSKTFNKNEIEKVLTAWFSKELGLDEGELKRETLL